MALTNDLLEDNCRDDITFNNILFFYHIIQRFQVVMHLFSRRSQKTIWQHGIYLLIIAQMDIKIKNNANLSKTDTVQIANNM